MQYRRRPVLKHDSFIERYPKLFGACFLTVCFGMLFSRPMFDFYMSFQSFLKEKEMTKKFQSKREAVEKE